MLIVHKGNPYDIGAKKPYKGSGRICVRRYLDRMSINTGDFGLVYMYNVLVVYILCNTIVAEVTADFVVRILFSSHGY